MMGLAEIQFSHQIGLVRKYSMAAKTLFYSKPLEVNQIHLCKHQSASPDGVSDIFFLLKCLKNFLFWTLLLVTAMYLLTDLLSKLLIALPITYCFSEDNCNIAYALKTEMVIFCYQVHSRLN